MADNVPITAGSGTTIATDDVSAVHYQKVKLVDGTADSSTAIPGDATNGLDVDVTRVQGNVTVVDGGGSLTIDGSITATSAGDVAHGVTNSGNPLQTGMEAIAHGTNPSAVAAGQRTKTYANRQGIPFALGGHPNLITISARITGANTDVALAPTTVNTGTKLVVTRLTITVSNATTVNVGCKIGFGATTLPADSATGATGVLIDSDGFPPGGGVALGMGGGILGIGADGEELRVTNDAPTSGTIHVSYSYYSVDS